MGPGVAGYLIVIGAAFAVTFVSMPFLRSLSLRVGAVVQPDARRVHKVPTPILGGAGILAGVLVGLLAAWLSGEFAPVFRTIAPPLGVVLAATVIWGVGQIDDLRELSPPAKLAGIVLAGSILSIAGVSIIFFRIPFFGLYALSPDLSALITVVWVAGMVNAINLIDGLDGLAAGIVAIASGALFLFADRLGDPSVAQLPADNAAPLIARINIRNVRHRSHGVFDVLGPGSDSGAKDAGVASKHEWIHRPGRRGHIAHCIGLVCYLQVDGRIPGVGNGRAGGHGDRQQPPQHAAEPDLAGELRVGRVAGVDANVDVVTGDAGAAGDQLQVRRCRAEIDQMAVEHGVREVTVRTVLAPASRACSTRASITASVCTGAFLLAQAGLVHAATVPFDPQAALEPPQWVTDGVPGQDWDSAEWEDLRARNAREFDRYLRGFDATLVEYLGRGQG